MPTVRFSFGDFKERLQWQVVVAVREHLLASGEIEREEGESAAALDD